MLYSGEDFYPESGKLLVRKKDGSEQVFPGFYFEQYQVSPSVVEKRGGIVTTSIADRKKNLSEVLGRGFGRTDFSRIYLFEPTGFFADFVVGFFLLIFCGKKVPRKILQENPRRNRPKSIQQKSPTHFWRGAGPTNDFLQFCHRQPTEQLPR